MKRIIISIILFTLCVTGSLIELFCVGNSVDNYLSEIDAIDHLMMKDDFSAASQKCSELEDKWGDTLKSIDIVLIHDYVDQISINISQMSAYIDNLSPDMYFASSEAAKKALESVKDSEYPFLENLL